MICHRCGATVPEELPICGSCGQDLTIRTEPEPEEGEVFGGDTEPLTEVSGLSGSLRLREAGFAARQQGLPYTTGDVVVDRYQIDDVIAEGPVGVVYSAVDLDMDTQIALKVVLSEYFPDARELARFGQAMSRTHEMSHPNIVRVYDTGPDESRFLIAQRLVMGRTLAEVLAERLPQGIPSPPEEVSEIVTQVGEALAYAHPDTPHGALKPTNIIILPAGLKLTDFCLASAISRDAYLAGHRLRRLPTRYLAPELLAGRSVDFRADLYSLAVMGTELLTGRPLPADPARLAGELAGLADAARPVLEAALNESPGRRPDDADEVVEAILSAAEQDTGGVPDTASLAVGDTTNVLDLSDVEVIDDGEDPTNVGDAPEYLDVGDETEVELEPPTSKYMPAHRERLDDELDDLTKPTPARSFPSEPTHRHAIPPAEPSTDQYRRVDPSALVEQGDPEDFIEAAPGIQKVPDIDLDGRLHRERPGLFAKGPAVRPGPKASDALEAMDFDASLEKALASAAAEPAPLPPPGGLAPAPAPARKKRKRKRGPGYDPDPEAMKDRPVAAAGVTLAATQNSKLDLPVMEPAVAVEPDPAVTAQPAKGGTAQIPVPDRPKSRLGLWIGLVLFAMLCVGGTVGVIVYKRAQDKKAAEAEQRRRARLRRIALQNQAMQGGMDGGMTGTMALPLDPGMSGGTRPKQIQWRNGCPVTAVRIKQRRKRIDFCIDRFEYPGKRGVKPHTVLDEDTAVKLCRKQGKRLCTRAEWQYACAGRGRNLFSYGDSFQQGTCATAGPSNQKLPISLTGSHPRCRTSTGLYDMNGNVAEWVQGSQLLGGSAGKPGNQTSCRSDTGAGGSAYYGFRCCATPRRR